MRSSACSIPGILVCIFHSNEDSRRLIIVSTCQFCQGRTSVTFVDNMPIVVSRSTTWYAISLLIRRLRCTLVNACSISTGKVELCVGRPTRKNYVIAYIFTEMTIISFIYGVTDCPYGHQEPEVRCAPRRGPRRAAGGCFFLIWANIYEKCASYTLVLPSCRRGAGWLKMLCNLQGK